MRVADVIRVGEVVEIKYRDRYIRTTLQEFLGEDDFAVFQPTIFGLPIYAEKDEVFSFVSYKNDGIYTFRAQIKEMYTEDELRLCRFKQTSEVERCQRRQAYRLPTVLEVEIEYIDGIDEKEKYKVYKGKTVNLSEKSVQLTCFSRIQEETLVNVEIHFDDMSSIILKAIVIRCTKPDKKNDPYEIVLKFVDCLDKDITYVRRFIIKQQVKQNKMDRQL